MKKCIFCLIAVLLSLLCLTACEQEGAQTFTPLFEIGEGYTLAGDVISGTVIGEEYIDLFSVFTTHEDFVIFGDSSAETFLEHGVIPLVKGNNHLVVRFLRDGAEREYNLEIVYVPISSFSVEIVNEEKTYHIGEKFDKDTILVQAVTESGECVTVDSYRVEYAFSELGESDVGIELGNMYESITVLVTEEYLPVLDGNFKADGVSYALRGDEAVLLSAPEAEGFFAIPRSVIYKGVEYPVTEMANGACSRTPITSVLIPYGMKTLSASVFSGCILMEAIEIPDSVEQIGRQAFSGCESLSRVVLPEGLTSLEYGVFEDCSSLFRVKLPDGLTVVGEGAFSGCASLKAVSLPSSLLRLEANAFEDCTALVSIILPNVEYIGNGAFRNCKSLTACAIADAVVIDAGAFDETDVTLYTSMTGRVLAYAASEEIPYVIVNENTPCLIHLPDTFAIEDDYPYAEVLALILSENRISALKNYEVVWPKDACGYLEATLIWGDFSHSYEIFVSYTEMVLTDTDTRGARYSFDLNQKTATLVALPEYVKPGKIYVSGEDGLFIVPTALACPDGIYTVIDVKKDALGDCQNVSSIFIPVMVSEK